MLPRSKSELQLAREARHKRVEHKFVLVSWLLLIAFLAGTWWIYGSDTRDSVKVNVLFAWIVCSPILLLVWRQLCGLFGARRALRDDWLDSLAQCDFPCASTDHVDVDMFLQDVCDDSSIAIKTRLVASRWLGQISIKRAQYSFANVEIDALQDAFVDYKRLGIGTGSKTP